MNSVILVIDPQKGFTSSEGTLGRTHGSSELHYIQSTLSLLAETLPRLAVYSTTVLVCSHYRLNQFSGESMKALCVPAISSDCEIDEALASYPFDFRFIKSEKSAPSSKDFSDWLATAIAADTKLFILSGFLLEHCVLSTALDLRAAVPTATQIVVATDLVASRKSKYGKNGAVKAAMEQLAAYGIELLSSNEIGEIIADRDP